jgi:hypothetical protein
MVGRRGVPSRRAASPEGLDICNIIPKNIMGYTKIVQYGNITEIYEYDKNITNRRNPSWAKAERLAHGGSSNKQYETLDIAKKRKKRLRVQSKAKKIYKRSESSIKRSKRNFFRLCHHNNCNADSIHFLTLTFSYDLSFKEASRHVARFMERVRSAQPEVSVDFISVPELTKNGRFHFHLLVYNLLPEVSGYPIQIRKYNRKKRKWDLEEATTERFTRNLQRLFQRGYVDIVPASYTSRGIAGYMAKYMGKALSDSRYETTRGYNCSRGIKKIRSAGSNSLTEYAHLIIPEEDVEEISETSYNVPYLGSCRFKKIKVRI